MVEVTNIKEVRTWSALLLCFLLEVSSEIRGVFKEPIRVSNKPNEVFETNWIVRT